MDQASLIPGKNHGKLKVLLVLKGYSSFDSGKGMKVLDWRKKLYDFIYDDPLNKVSHADLLCKGLSDYSYLYDRCTYQVINKEGKAIDVEGLKLKTESILDYSKPYYAGVHITSNDIKLTNCSGKVNFIAPKTLLN